MTRISFSDSFCVCVVYRVDFFRRCNLFYLQLLLTCLKAHHSFVRSVYVFVMAVVGVVLFAIERGKEREKKTLSPFFTK